MEAEVVSISYDRKSKKRIEEVYVKKKTLDDSFQNQFVRIIAEGMKDSGIFKICTEHRLLDAVA